VYLAPRERTVVEPAAQQMRARPGERRLPGLLHHVAELPGQHEPLPRRRLDLDAQHLAAGLGPREPVRDADLADRVRLEIEVARRTKEARQAARVHLDARDVASAARRAILRQIVATWRSRFRTPASLVYCVTTRSTASRDQSM
jgi:hypothetical protein